MIQVSATELQQAGRILRRLPYGKNATPELRHILGSARNGDFTLAVACEKLRLEYRIRNAAPADMTAGFLIPAEVLRDAAEGGRRSLVRIEASQQAGQPAVAMTMVSGARECRKEYPMPRADSFPEAPVAAGPTTVLPKETMEAVQRVAPFADKDAKRRAPICGVHFSPTDGGMVIATDGKQLGMLPAKVPDQPFLLPEAAIKVIDHQCFANGDVEFMGCADGWVGFSRENLTLFANTTADRFPDHRGIVQDRSGASAEIPENQIPQLVAWLRSIKGASASVLLRWDKPGRLTLAPQDTREEAATTFELPVDRAGDPSPVSLKPSHLANALAIGRTIRVAGPEMPLLVTGEDGGTSALMPLRILPSA